MLRAAVIWRVRALQMSGVSCLCPTELRRIRRFRPLGCRFQPDTAVNSPLEFGRMVWLSCPDWAIPIVHPPALMTGLRASLQLTNTRPPLQMTVYKHLVEL
jgi:hypothetical protein